MRACASGSSAAAAHEHADAPHPLGLLRARGERPRSRRAAENADKFPPPHVRPGSGHGIVSAQTSTLIEAETGFATAT